MKKVIAIVAVLSLHSVHAFAFSATEAAGEAGTELGTEMKGAREGIRPGKAVGGKLTGTPVYGSKSTAAAGVTQPLKAPTPPAQTGVDSHVTCPATSPVGQLSASEQAAMALAFSEGVGGQMCAEHFDQLGQVQIVAHVDKAGVDEVKALGLSNLSQASQGQIVQIETAMEKRLGDELGVDPNEAHERMKTLCANGCDVGSQAVCNVVR